MGDPFLTLKFAQSLGQQKPLTQLGAGIAQIHDTWKQADAQKQIGQAYDNSFQQYMQDPSAEKKAQLLQVAQRAGNYDETISTIGQVEQQRAAEAEAARIAELDANWKESLDTLKVEQTSENYFAAAQAAQAAGKLDDHNEMVEDWTEEQRKDLADQYLGVYAMIQSGSLDLAAQKSEELGDMYDNVGNDTASDIFDHVSALLEDGNTQAALTALGTYSASMPEVGEALERVLAQKKEDRADRAEEREVEKIKRDIVLESMAQEFTKEEKDRLTELARHDPELGAYALEQLRYANLVEAGMQEDLIQVRKFELDLNNKWRQYNVKLDGVKTSHTGLLNIYEDIQANGGGVGWVDPVTFEVVDANTDGAIKVEGIRHIAAMNLFQRMIDPATVREGDIDLINSANNLLGQIKLGLANLETGAKISDDQLVQMIETGRSLELANQKWVDEEAFPALESIVSTTPGAIFRNVFGDYVPPEERLEMVEIMAQRQAANDHLLRGITDPDVIAAVRTARDIETLKRMYPDSMADFTYTPAAEVKPSEFPQDQLARLRSHIIVANRNEDYWDDDREAWVQNATAEQLANTYKAGYREFTNSLEATGDGDGGVLDLFDVGGGE